MRDSDQTHMQAALLEAVLENTVDAIITITPKGIIDSVNPATERMFGYSSKELIGENIKILMPSPYRDSHDDHLENYRATGTKKLIGIGREFVGRRKDKSTFPMKLDVVEVKIGDRHVFTGIVRDISQQKEIERQLNAANERLESAVLAAILENAVDAIINIDTAGTIDSVNPAAETMFGYESREMIGENVNILMPNPYRDAHDKYMQNYVSTGEKKIIGVGREVVGRRKDGTIFPMHLGVSEIKVDDRHLFTGVVRDITAEKDAERKLAEVNEQLESLVREKTSELKVSQADLIKSEKYATLGKVSGGIAHEIRNPLNAMKTSAYYLLNAKHRSEEKTREHLERIDRQVSMIDNVVTALSDVAKLPEASLISTELPPILQSAITSVNLPDNVEVDLVLEEDMPEVMVDTNQIAIVFKNLIRNARDAMDEGGKLTLDADVGKEFITVSVTDTGCGISEENLAEILEPLFTTKASGMGLGLSISRAIVEKNKGKLTVESELGVGSTFSISIRRSDR